MGKPLECGGALTADMHSLKTCASHHFWVEQHDKSLGDTIQYVRSGTLSCA